MKHLPQDEPGKSQVLVSAVRQQVKLGQDHCQHSQMSLPFVHHEGNTFMASSGEEVDVVMLFTLLNKWIDKQNVWIDEQNKLAKQVQAHEQEMKAQSYEIQDLKHELQHTLANEINRRKQAEWASCEDGSGDVLPKADIVSRIDF